MIRRTITAIALSAAALAIAPTAANAATTHHHVVSCTVTATKPVKVAGGADTTVTSTCHTAVHVTVSVQAQIPGPWHQGICRETGSCHLISRTVELIPALGSRTLHAAFTDCRVQVDIKLGTHLLRAGQFGTTGCKVTPTPTPKPKPPVVHHHPKPPATNTITHHKTPAARVRLTASAELPRTGGLYTAGLLGGAGLVLGGIAAVILAGVGGTSPRTQAKRMRAAIANTSARSSKAARS